MIKPVLKYGLLTACLVLILVNMSSCDDNSGSIPEILYVRAISNPDSAFVIANAGQEIVIIGKNLQGAKKIYINDQSVTFDPLFNTETNIVVTIPEEKTEDTAFELLYTEEGDILSIQEGTIRIETHRGIASYAFTVLGGDPSISMINAGEYPFPTGSMVEVSGNDFVNIRRVYFTNIDPHIIQEEIIDSCIISEEIVEPEEIIEIINGFNVKSTRYLDQQNRYIVESKLTFSLPELPRIDGNYSGYLVIETGGKAAQRFTTIPAPIIENISGELPVPEGKLSLDVSYFY
jgi:hypothetical protein